MTEGSSEDGNFLVRVRAQVMTRDDSTGGWVPMGAGGLSIVCVRKRMTLPSSSSSVDEDVPGARPEYLIFGKRIADQTIVLNCTIKKDFQYHKVMPTFHHWRTGDKKFGLTFQTAADARAFDKGVKFAVQDLSFDIDLNPTFHDADIGDDDVFMTVKLPVDSRSSSGSSCGGSGSGVNISKPASTTPSVPGETFSATSSPHTQSHGNQQHSHHFPHIPTSHTMPGVSNSGASSSLSTSMSAEPADLQRFHSEEMQIEKRTSIKEQQEPDCDKIEPLPPGDPYSYVQFARGRQSHSEHEYSYPSVESAKTGQQEGGSFKKPYQPSPMRSSEPPLLPIKKKRGKKESRRLSPTGHSLCRHCLVVFSEENNRRGSCEYAPDRILTCINAATCISCAQCMLYHCMSDTEDDYDHHPCSCSSTDNHCHRRWTGLALLSIFVPCLWCYLPLRACHRCGASCGICGGKHEAP